jgi:hypothetical protein
MTALRTDDVVYFLFHQLGQHAEPNAHAEGEQPLLRCPDQLPKRFLDAPAARSPQCSPARAIRSCSLRFLL